jgi:hypothetical protein
MNKSDVSIGLQNPVPFGSCNGGGAFSQLNPDPVQPTLEG